MHTFGFAGVSDRPEHRAGGGSREHPSPQQARLHGHPGALQRQASSIVAALRPGGRLILAEYRDGVPAVRSKPLHTMTDAQARRERESAGMRWVEIRSLLPPQHFLVFEKP